YGGPRCDLWGRDRYGLIVEVPEGTVDGLTVTDTLPAGLELVNVALANTWTDIDSNTGTYGGGDATTYGFSVSVDGTAFVPGTSAPVTNGSSSQSVLVSFSDGLVNADASNSSTNNQFVILVTARVVNNEEIPGGSILPGEATRPSDDNDDSEILLGNLSSITNTVSSTFESGETGASQSSGTISGGSTTVTTEVVRPDLQITKVADIESANPGDTVTYTLTISHTASSSADAFDVYLFDDISNLSAVQGVISNIVASDGTTVVNEVDNQLQISIPEMVLNGSPVTITYEVTLGAFDDLVGADGEVPNVVNTADLAWYSVGEENNAERRREVTLASENVVIIGPDLSISKDDGIQQRQPGEEYTYTLTYQNAAEHTGVNAGEPVGTATNVVIVDTLPKELEFISSSVTPASMVENTNGTITIIWNVGDLSSGEGGAITVDVQVSAEVPEGITVPIINRVTIPNDSGDKNLANNSDSDTDELFKIIETLEEVGDGDFRSGSEILEGFRFAKSMLEEEEEEEEEAPGGIPEEAEDEERQPILSIVPIYSGLVDPGTVLKISIVGADGNIPLNGETTVVADAGGNWLAKFPGLSLTDEPRQIVIEQTRPAWDVLSDHHGYNLRTYFAPGISPSHVQAEDLSISSVMTRRLGAFADMVEHTANPGKLHNDDWRLRMSEFYAESGVGGILQQ
ncbi:MAG: DUF11 domain-containing protein, partial [Verrucomicrobiota bacterium]